MVARDASSGKIVSDSLKERAIHIGGGAAIGATLGAGAGSQRGETKEGGVAGAVIGAALGAKGTLIDVAVRRGLEKSAPAMAAAAKKSPALARAIESATASHGGGSGSISGGQQ
jgi:hypothetical protein